MVARGRMSADLPAGALAKAGASAKADARPQIGIYERSNERKEGLLMKRTIGLLAAAFILAGAATLTAPDSASAQCAFFCDCANVVDSNSMFRLAPEDFYKLDGPGEHSGVADIDTDNDCVEILGSGSERWTINTNEGQAECGDSEHETQDASDVDTGDSVLFNFLSCLNS
jgi:hypothetical protein